MIVQASGLLDDLDKELNTCAMRVQEWYGWHFPELAKIIQDNVQFAKTVKLMGIQTNAADLDFSDIGRRSGVRDERSSSHLYGNRG
jgi:nucleolar protein 58